MVTTVTVKINGIEYNLKGQADEKYLKHVANYVEGKIQELMVKNNKLTMPAASALAAVNIADELFKGNKEYNELSDEFDTIKKENERLKQELTAIKEEFEVVSKERDRFEILASEELEVEVESLRKQVSELDDKNKTLKRQNTLLMEKNKEIRFDLQSYRYKTLDLEKKFSDSQVKLAIEKKSKNPLLQVNK